MRLALVTDTASSDLNTALEVAQEFLCREFELRELGFDAVPDIDERWIAAAERAVQRRTRVSALCVDFFRQSALPSSETIQKTLAMAQRLQCKRINIFGGSLDDAVEVEGIDLPSPTTLDAIRAFHAAARNAGCEVVIRTHQDTCAGTVEESLAVLKALAIPDLGIGWDVGECLAAGDDTGLEMLEEIRPHLKAVYVRDAVRKGLSADWVSLGKGVIPWEDILEQLFAANYRGPVVLDSGITPKLKESRHALTLLARWIAACRTRRPANREFDDEC